MEVVQKLVEGCGFSQGGTLNVDALRFRQEAQESADLRKKRCCWAPLQDSEGSEKGQAVSLEHSGADHGPDGGRVRCDRDAADRSTVPLVCP